MNDHTNNNSLKPELMRSIWIALPIVFIGRLAMALDMTLGAWILLPGNMVNMVVLGVHGTWTGILAEFTTLVPSLFGWFVAALTIQCLLKQSRS